MGELDRISRWGLELGIAGDRQQIDDLRRLLLAETVDATVALLQRDQRPGQIEVDQVVALAVQVHTLRRHVTSEQDPYW